MPLPLKCLNLKNTLKAISNYNIEGEVYLCIRINDPLGYDDVKI